MQRPGGRDWLRRGHGGRSGRGGGGRGGGRRRALQPQPVQQRLLHAAGRHGAAGAQRAAQQTGEVLSGGEKCKDVGYQGQWTVILTASPFSARMCWGRSASCPTALWRVWVRGAGRGGRGSLMCVLAVGVGAEVRRQRPCPCWRWSGQESLNAVSSLLSHMSGGGECGTDQIRHT